MSLLLAVVLSLGDPGASTAKMGVALGTVETKPAGAADYAPAAAGAAIDADTWIRTGAGAKAAVDFADGTELRLDQNTEVHLQNARKIVLKVGLIYAKVAEKADVFTAETKFAPMETNGGLFELAFINRDPDSPEYKQVSRTVTELMVMEGKVKVKSRRYAQVVTANYHCNLIDSQLNTPDPNPNPMIATRWVNPLVAARGPAAGPELQMRVETYISRLALVEKDDPCEAGLRELGTASVTGLAELLKYPGTASEAARRRAAARVLADVCPASSGDALLRLLKDADAQVKASAIKGLQRLTGKDLGTDEKAWAEALR